MELELTPDQEELRDSVRTVLGRECPRALVRSVVEDGARPDALWATMTELGWPALTVPEAHGGLGRGFVEAALVAEELGRALAPGPWLPTVTQFVPVLAELGDADQQARFLGAVAEGSLTGTLAVAEAAGAFDAAAVEAVATPHHGGIRLDGRKRFVMEGASVDEIVVVAREPTSTGAHGITAAVVPAASVRVEAVATIDGTRPLADVVLDGVDVPAERVLGPPGGAATGVERAVEQATAALALELVGTGQTIFDDTLAYARERRQFGVPIGSFQAVKHRFADLLVALERARATGYLAALTIAEDDPRRASATSVAKAAASDAQRLLAKDGIQLHGGIGFTWEHDMHLFVKRLKGSDPLFGSGAWHRARLADLLGV